MIYQVTAILMLVVFTEAQQCAPDPVLHIYLEDSTLSWDPSTNCQTVSYIVLIHATAGTIDHVYTINTTSLDVSFLSYCRPYIFTISPVSDNIVGPHTQLLTRPTLPADTKISITDFKGFQVDGDVVLEWAVPAEYTYCPSSYKVRIWDEDGTDFEEIRTNENGYYIKEVAQCMTYQVEIYVECCSIEHPVSQFNYTVPQATNTPSLQYIRQDVATINTTWALEKFATNRCEVSALHVNGAQFNTIIPIQDSPERPTVDVSIAGLRANSMYYFNVTIENEAGLSSPFQLAVQTLPIEENLEIW